MQTWTTNNNYGLLCEPLKCWYPSQCVCLQADETQWSVQDFFIGRVNYTHGYMQEGQVALPYWYITYIVNDCPLSHTSVTVTCIDQHLVFMFWPTMASPTANCGATCSVHDMLPSLAVSASCRHCLLWTCGRHPCGVWPKNMNTGEKPVSALGIMSQSCYAGSNSSPDNLHFSSKLLAFLTRASANPFDP